MRRHGYEGHCWPSPLQEGLLRAALLPAEQASAAWAALRPGLDLDDIWDPEVHRILPLVAVRLREAGVDDPDLPRLQGLARRTWYENQLRINEAATVVASLEAAGIRTMLLKGVPLALRYYESAALRPMSDVDVLVPTAQGGDALAQLAADGWMWDSRFLNRFHHGVGLVRAGGRAIDLHWHLGLPFVLPGADASSDDDFWAVAEPLDIGGVTSRTLAATDMLLHVCAHGAWSDSAAQVRWIADAMTVLRAAAEIDWSRFEDQVRRRRLTLLVSEPLRYLAEVYDAPIPADVRSRIAAMPTTMRERACRRRSIGPVEGEGVAGRLRMVLAQWSRTSAKWSRLQAVRELPFFLQQAWCLDSVWSVPGTALRKLSRRISTPRAAM